MTTQLTPSLEIDPPTTRRRSRGIDQPSSTIAAGGLTARQQIPPPPSRDPLTPRQHARPTFRSTRGGRIRYDLRSVIKKRARQKERERARARNGTIVIGRFLLDGDAVILEAVQWEIGYWIATPPAMTRSFKRFARWRTRQAANQWLQRHPDPRCQPVNLRTLRGRQDSTES